MLGESKQAINGLVLGLDIGAASVGWALVEFEANKPTGLKALGARVFPAAISKGNIGAIESGAEESSAKHRREKRSLRRQIERTRRRLTKLAKLLQRHELLPPGQLDSSKQIHEYFLELDERLFPKSSENSNKREQDRDQQVRYYRLRARALDCKLTRYEIGRALYHLAHHRGFLSNAKATTRRKKEDGPVKDHIREVDQEMSRSEARTLGELLSRSDPSKARIRGAGQYVGRDEQIRPEFEKIWQRQASYYPDLSDLKEEVSDAIFFQRDFRIPTKHLGFCSIEGNPADPQRRAPMALLAAQRFRILDKVNILRFVSGGVSRDLTPGERKKLFDKLDVTEDLDFDKMRKTLGLGEGRFNLETLGTKKLIGNRTAARLAVAVGKKCWSEMTRGQQDRLVDDLLTRTLDAVYRRALRRGLGEEKARKLSEVELESGYCRLSRRALKRILLFMEQEGLPYATARAKCYPRNAGDALPLLPPLDSVEEVRNPIVTRALTEMRKVVNAVVREYGLPERVRIELARDLKRNKKQRSYVHGRMLDNERSRAEARVELTKMGEDPSGPNIERYLLWNECNHHCPLCGQPISQHDAFCQQTHVSHIIPRERALHLRNSFLNKVLCHAACNFRQGNRTPWEAFGDTADWTMILDNVRKFKGEGRGREVAEHKTKKKGSANSKLELFELKELDQQEFTRRQLQDTQYASRLAVEYVGQLHGTGPDGYDAERIKRVQVSRGQLTSGLRNAWGLNGTEIGGGDKKREDHRHHALDALCIALTDEFAIQELSRAVDHGLRQRGQRCDNMPLPWPAMLGEARRAIAEMVVSHRIERSVAGGMHKDNHYGRYEYEGRTWAHIRVPLQKLTANDAANIVDTETKENLQKALGGKPFKEAFRDKKNHPFKDPSKHPSLGRNIIHKVRVRRPTPLRTISGELRERHVELGDNHHMEVLELAGVKSSIWEGVVVSTYDAMRRLREGLPVVQKDHGEGRRFLFSLAGGEIIEFANDGVEGKRELYVVRSIWMDKRVSKKGEEQQKARIALCRIHDAREKDQIKRSGDWDQPFISSLRGKARKVLITPLGEIRDAHD